MKNESNIYETAKRTEQYLASFFVNKPEEYHSVLDAMEYSLMAGGKRLRPLLSLEFCKLCGGDSEKAMAAGAAVEMIHSYSLIHDDLPCMDDDDMRRGKPSCHIQFGEATALLAGDGLLTLAFECIADSELTDVQKVRCSLELAKAAGAHGMIAGQMIDLDSENQQISEDLLRQLCAKKTGEIIRVAARMGCICANATEKQIDAADQYAAKIGLAFQIQDDILDIVGNEQMLGKPIGSDAQSHKNTFATMYGVDQAVQMVLKLTEQAKDALCIFDSQNRTFLADLADYLTTRQN